MHDFICPVYDSTYKYLWKDKNCRKWFTKLIKYITNVDLSEYTLYDPELDSGNNKKVYKLDILFLKGDTSIEDADIFNIEMYKNYSKTNEIKSNTYIFYLMGASYYKGEKYIERTGIQVNFHDYYCQSNPNLSITRCMFRDIDNNIEKDDIVIYDIYLPKFKGICYNGKNEMEAMLALLHCKSYEEMRRVASSNKEALSIVEELERLSTDEKFIGVYDAEKVYKKDINSAKDEGMSQGLELGHQDAIHSLESIQKLINDGANIKEISKLVENEKVRLSSKKQ